MSQETFQIVMASGMMFVQVVAFLVVVLYFLKKEYILKFFKNHGAKIGFGMAVTAVVGCGIFTEVYGFVPCKLCWWQRIFMIPSVFLFAGALFWKDTRAYFYVLAMSLVGICVSIYQWFIQNTSIFPAPTCSIDSASCTSVYFTEFGYITPVVILGTTFLVFIIISSLTLKGVKICNK